MVRRSGREFPFSYHQFSYLPVRWVARSMFLVARRPLQSQNFHTRIMRKFAVIAAITLLPPLAQAMDILWTRMTGQWPVEASPLVGNFTGSSPQEILILNRGGQLLLWSPDAKALGPGQDGAVAQLPAGDWTTAPTLLGPSSATRFVVANVRGLVVGLDAKFQVVWQHKLPGQTVWGRATPALVRTTSGLVLVFSDLSGTASALTLAGEVAWTNALGAGPCQSPPKIFSVRPGEDSVLVPANA